MKTFFLHLIALLLIASPSYGQNIPTFSIDNLDMNTLMGKKGVVVIFTSSQCKFATQYVSRLNDIYNQYQSKDIAFVAINSNDVSLCPSEDAKNMRAVSAYQFPYVKDADQRVARLFGAEKTPEVYIIRPSGSQFEVVYKGAVDDNPLDASMVRNSTLRAALDQMLSGGKPVNANIGMGCPIKWSR
jgi:peroxiredoxin